MEGQACADGEVVSLEGRGSFSILYHTLPPGTPGPKIGQRSLFCSRATALKMFQGSRCHRLIAPEPRDWLQVFTTFRLRVHSKGQE